VIVSPFLNAASGVDGIAIDLPHALYLRRSPRRRGTTG